MSKTTFKYPSPANDVTICQLHYPGPLSIYANFLKLFKLWVQPYKGS